MRWWMTMVLALAACEGGEGARSSDTGDTDSPAGSVTCPPSGRYELVARLCDGDPRHEWPDDVSIDMGRCYAGPPGERNWRYSLTEGAGSEIVRVTWTEWSEGDGEVTPVGTWEVAPATDVLAETFIVRGNDQGAPHSCGLKGGEAVELWVRVGDLPH